MFKDLQKQYPSFLVLILVFMLGSIYLFQDSMSKYPSYVHAWTQSDRLALAQNFQSNGFDFFHPATYNLLTQDGITQVDFPIHDFLVAAISQALDLSLIQSFRWYNLIYSLLGLIFFFRLCLSMNLSGVRSVFASLFIFTLPFFTYYQNGFLPSIPSFANLLIGLHFLSQYQSKSSRKSLVGSIVFISLSALSRSPFFIYLLAIFAALLLRQIRRKKLVLHEILYPVLGIIAFLTYWFYNKILGETYGSMFLMEFRNIEGLADFIRIVQSALGRWAGELLSPFHWFIIGLTFLIGIVQSRKKDKAKIQLLESWWLISLLGVLLFFALMGQQFVDHDYYYIDCMLPLLSLLWIFALKRLKLRGRAHTSFALLCFLFVFYFFSYAKDTLKKRYTPPWNDRIEYAYSIYEESSQDIKDWGLQENDTLTVLEANSTNIPFTVLKNKGYTSLNSLEDSVRSILKKPSDYVLMIDSFFRLDSYRDFPDLIYQLKRVNGNGKVTLYKNEAHQNPSLFFERLYHHSSIDFDAQLPESPFFQSNYILAKKDGNQYMEILPDREYNLTFEQVLTNPDQSKDLEIMVLADYYQVQDTSKFQLVCSFGAHYYTHYTENTLTEINEWTKKYYRFKIPKEKLESSQNLKIYFWNQSKKELWVDNLYLSIYQ